jgi:hypothetical protein
MHHILRDPALPGLCRGQTRWGWRLSAQGTLVRDEREQAVVACVRHMRATGAKLREIVETMKSIGVVGRSGRPLKTTRVFELIHGRR